MATTNRGLPVHPYLGLPVHQWQKPVNVELTFGFQTLLKDDRMVAQTDSEQCRCMSKSCRACIATSANDELLARLPTEFVRSSRNLRRFRLPSLHLFLLPRLYARNLGQDDFQQTDAPRGSFWGNFTTLVNGKAKTLVVASTTTLQLNSTINKRTR